MDKIEIMARALWPSVWGQAGHGAEAGVQWTVRSAEAVRDALEQSGYLIVPAEWANRRPR